MTDERLYIDGVLVDIGTDTKITLDVKSNLFRDISKIVSNNTYTVKLPKTVRNQMILEHTDLVQSDGDYPYLFHQARYFRNGVEVIKDGRATILAVTDEAIEVCIVWGLYPNFSTLVSEGATLNQMESEDRILRLVEGSNGKAVGVFDINMQTILNTKYAELINTLQSAKVVKETMRVRDIDLLEFDETKPVYLAQYGAYFAVMEIKSESNGLAEVEMLKLNF